MLPKYNYIYLLYLTVLVGLLCIEKDFESKIICSVIFKGVNILQNLIELNKIEYDRK